MTFSRVLIANRGEIAVRVIRSVKALGYEAIAVYSKADRDAPHVQAADEAVEIGPAPVRESYLSIVRILHAARETGADALHPGYGFLSENAAFAAAAVEAGLVFIGPSAEAIRVMGDKRLAKQQAIAAGVPCAPGYMGDDQRLKVMLTEARRVGFPLLVKAAAGGGGRGMRIVREAGELESRLASARSEAENAFGDGTLYLERLIEGAHHIEVQVFADQHGTTIHLGERECSLQRRHQKIIEEAPSPLVDEGLRKALGAAAVNLARNIGYVGAGTVEFLVDRNRAFYFLEMNTRLQVEHPVTEMITGLDLVALQLRIAAGEPLAITQDRVRFDGHAVEARLCAEDPYTGYLPQTGRVLGWRAPSGPAVRVDAGIAEGSEITSFYDPLVAKIIVRGPTRAEALRCLSRALADTVLLGLKSNRGFLVDLLRDPCVRSGEATTDYLDGRPPLISPEPPAWLMGAAALLLCIPAGMSLETWKDLGEGRWRLTLDGHGEPLASSVARTADGCAHVIVGEHRLEFRPRDLADGCLRLETGGRLLTVQVARCGSQVWVQSGPHTLYLADISRLRSRDAVGNATGSVRAPITGRVIAVMAAIGREVVADEPIAVLEAMKMEMEIRAPCAGRLQSLNVTVGAQIPAGHVIAEIDPATDRREEV